MTFRISTSPVVWSAVAITGGSINGTTIGGSVPSTGAFTTLSASGVFTSTVSTGTAPLTVASTTQVANLNASQLIGGTWAIPGSIGATTPNAGSFTTLAASGTSTLGTVNASGIVGVGGASNSLAVLTIGTTNPLTGSAQIGIYMPMTATSAATVAVRGVQVGITTATAAYTVADAWQFYAPDIVLGGGSAITRAINYYSYDHGKATSNVGFYHGTSGGTITGNYSLYAATDPAFIGDSTASTTTGTGALVVTGGVGIGGRLNVGGIIQGSGNIRSFGGAMIADYSTGGATGGAASTIESNANVVLWSSNYYYNGANDVRARAGGTSRLRMDITTGASAGDVTIQCATTGAADSVISYGNVATFKTTGTALAGTLSVTGAASVTDTTDSVSIATGSLVVSGGIGVAKRLTLDGATGKTLRIVNGVANAAVATTLGSVGPTGSTAGNPQGWMRVDINGTDRYIPYW